jgi:hypothetical protein
MLKAACDLVRCIVSSLNLTYRSHCFCIAQIFAFIKQTYWVSCNIWKKWRNVLSNCLCFSNAAQYHYLAFTNKLFAASHVLPTYCTVYVYVYYAFQINGLQYGGRWKCGASCRAGDFGDPHLSSCAQFSTHDLSRSCGDSMLCSQSCP